MAEEAYRHEPRDLDLEQAVLGSLLQDNRLIDVAAAELKSAELYDPLHARMLEMIIGLFADGDQVSVHTLYAVMKHDPGVIETGGIAYLDALRAAAPALPAMRTMISQLKELAFRRELLKLGAELQAGVYEGPKEAPSKALADRATEALLYIGAATVKPITSAYEAAMESLREAERHQRGEPVPVVMTGFHKVDLEMGGWRGGDFIVIAGKSGMGKSALMCSIALNAALMGTPVIFFSLEMKRRQVVDRMVCALDYPENDARPMWYSKIRNGKMNNDEFDRFAIAANRLPGPELLEIHDDDGLTVAQISARARAFAAKYCRNKDGTQKMGLVIVDYVQIVEPAAGGYQESRERQVSGIARGLKGLAKKLDWPVVGGSQFNDDDKHRVKEEKRPVINDARESKAIGNEADIFLSPLRPAYFVENRKPMDAPRDSPEMITWKGDMREVRHKLELLTLKNRHGRRVDFSLHCEIGSNAILDYAPGSAESAAEQAQADMLAELDQ